MKSVCIHDWDGNYRDGQIAGLIISADNDKSFRFMLNNIGVGSSKNDIIKAYGESAEESYKFLSYCLEKKDNSFNILTDDIHTLSPEKRKSLYYMTFSIYENGKVSMIVISDYPFAMRMN